MKQSERQSVKADHKPKVAIVGAGIAGLSCAYHLHQDYELSVFEKNDYFGGHTDTHSLLIDGQQERIDSGFIIFCPQYYPHFSSMLNDLGVDSKPTNMSFSAHNVERGVLYNATSISKLFCDRKNLFRLSFWRMLKDIVRFYRHAPQVLAETENQELSVSDYLNKHNYGVEFTEDHLLPMISALWSATPERVKQFPVVHLVDFFRAHGLMKIIGRPQWLVVKNGSATYVEALKKKVAANWHANARISGIQRHTQGVTIELEDGELQHFDALIMATHADVSLNLLADASDDERAILAAIPFEKNHVVVHTDESIMPSNKLAWASWNTEVPHPSKANSLDCCTANYWMNLLQGLDMKTNVFTSLNSAREIDQQKILAERYYDHPVFTAESVAAQRRLPEINGVNSTFYVGAFWSWGFHEDGARSAWNACQLLKQRVMTTRAASDSIKKSDMVAA